MQNLSKLFLCQLASLFKEVASPTCQHAFPAAEWSLELPPRAPSCTASALCPFACLCTGLFPSLLFISSPFLSFPPWSGPRDGYEERRAG